MVGTYSSPRLASPQLEASPPKENEDDEKDFAIDIDDDYLLNEGAQILSDYMLFNQNTYLYQAA